VSPAPWEPLPSWLAPAAPATPAAGDTLATPIAPAAPAAPIAAAPQRAERGRPLDTDPQPATAAEGQKKEDKPPAVDLDALARQVYGVLKRRLATEGRRST
jgi:hypothetical protein